ncbi:hypothetical protein CPB85DRAFT_1569407 [Mucidula mucida]|nr:hypothetical protein CPB85DRAFT_1569407 [Mucidula mucida]
MSWDMPETIVEALVTKMSSFSSARESLSAVTSPLATLASRSTGNGIHKMNDIQCVLGLHGSHLHAELQLKHVQPISNLPPLLAEYIKQHRNVTSPMPSVHPLTRQTRYERARHIETISFESVELLRDGHDDREKASAAFASALAGQSKSVSNPGFLRWSHNAQTVLPGSESALAGGYISIDPELCGMDAALRKSMQDDLATVEDLRLSDIVQVARQDIDLDSFNCGGPSSPHSSCRSEHCEPTPGPEQDHKRTVSGRPTGVDGDPATDLIRQALLTDRAFKPIAMDAKRLISLLLLGAWAKAVASDSTCIVISGGNKEIICIRHRLTQILYVSDVLDVTRIPARSPGHLAVHTGLNLFALRDAISRAQKIDQLRRLGALPATMTFDYGNEIDPLTSDLAFQNLKPFYNASIGKFLSPMLTDTFESQQHHFAIASKIYVHWDAKAIGDMPLLFTFENSTSPLCLTPEDAWTAGRPLHVRLHSKILHGSGVFLSHLIHDPDSDSTEESARSLMEGQEVGIMRKLSDFAYVNDPDFSQRIPRVYAVGTNDSLSREHHLIISAYFMEHFEEAYPLALADDISPHFRSILENWMHRLHDEYSIVHCDLSGENILFRPSEPQCFFVVGWGRALSIDDPWPFNGGIDQNALNRTLAAVTDKKNRREMMEHGPFSPRTRISYLFDK